MSNLTPSTAPSGPIRDDAGKQANLLTIGDLKKAAQDNRPAVRLTANRLRHALKAERHNMSAGAQLRVIVAAMIVLFGAPALAVPFQLIFPGRASGAVIHATSFVFLIVLVTIAFRFIFKNLARKQLAYTAVAEGVCGSCAFSLEGAPTVRVVTPRCPNCRAPVSVFNKCDTCNHRFERPATQESDCLTCSECGSAWLCSRVTRPHWAEPVHEPIRTLWYSRLVPGMRPKHASLSPDDRGRYVWVPDPRLLRVPPAVWERLGTIRRELASHTRHAGWGWRAGTATPLLLLAGMFATLMAAELNATRPELEYWVGMLLLTLLFGIPGVITLCSGLGRPPKTTVRRLAGLGHCGSCLTRLDQIVPDDAGLRVCPTCGASWRTAPTNAPARPPAADIPSPDAD